MWIWRCLVSAFSSTPPGLRVRERPFGSPTAYGQGPKRAAAIVKATALFTDPEVITSASRGLGEAMVGISVADVPAPHRLADRGW